MRKKSMVIAMAFAGYSLLGVVSVNAQEGYESYYYDSYYSEEMYSSDELYLDQDSYNEEQSYSYQEPLAEEFVYQESYYAEEPVSYEESLQQTSSVDQSNYYPAAESPVEEESSEESSVSSIIDLSEGATQEEIEQGLIPFEDVVVEDEEDMQWVAACMELEAKALSIHEECLAIEQSCLELEWSLAYAEEDPLAYDTDLSIAAQAEALRILRIDYMDKRFELRDIWSKYVNSDCATYGQIYLSGVNIYDCQLAH